MVACDKSYNAIVAKDWRGTLVFTLIKQVEINIPIQAKVEIFNWATQELVSHNIS